MNLHIEEPNNNAAKVWGTLLALAAVLFVLYFGFLMLTKPDAPEAFQIKSFYGKAMIYSAEKAEWLKPERDGALSIGDKILTAAESEVQLKLGEKTRIRVKKDSSFELLPASAKERIPTHFIDLEKGGLQIAVDPQNNPFQIKVAVPKSVERLEGDFSEVKSSGDKFIVTIQKGILMIDAYPNTDSVWVGLLKGDAEIDEGGFFKAPHKLGALEKVEVFKQDSRVISEVTSVTRNEWMNLREAYDLFEKSSAAEAQQLDLSKKAGTLFDFVFDHGTFFTPKTGHAFREFIEDESTGQVYLEAEYDVFPRGAFVGIYLKPRNLDLAKYETFTLEARRKPGEGYPMNTKIEVKAFGNTLRAFALKSLSADWETYEFPLRFKEEQLIDEITFVLAHDKVGESKQGAMQLRNFELVAAKPSANNS